MDSYSYVKVSLGSNSNAHLYNAKVVNNATGEEAYTDPLGCAEINCESANSITVSRNGSISQTFSCEPNAITDVYLSPNGLVQTDTMLYDLFEGGFTTNGKCLNLDELSETTNVYDSTGGTPSDTSFVPLLGCVSPLCSFEALSDIISSASSASSSINFDETEMEGIVNLGGNEENCDFIYSVVSNDDWITVSDKGATDFTVDIEGQEWYTSARTGTLTVTRIGDNSSKTITVNQASGASDYYLDVTSIMRNGSCGNPSNTKRVCTNLTIGIPSGYSHVQIFTDRPSTSGYVYYAIVDISYALGGQTSRLNCNMDSSSYYGICEYGDDASTSDQIRPIETVFPLWDDSTFVDETGRGYKVGKSKYRTPRSFGFFIEECLETNPNFNYCPTLRLAQFTGNGYTFTVKFSK